jgi:hypothetical protein
MSKISKKEHYQNAYVWCSMLVKTPFLITHQPFYKYTVMHVICTVKKGHIQVLITIDSPLNVNPNYFHINLLLCSSILIFCITVMCLLPQHTTYLPLIVFLHFAQLAFFVPFIPFLITTHYYTITSPFDQNFPSNMLIYKNIMFYQYSMPC